MEKLPNSPDIRLVTIAESADAVTKEMADASAYDYIKRLEARYAYSDAYMAFKTAIGNFASEITDGLLIGNDDLNSIFVDMPIYDGFLLGLAVTDKQLELQYGIPYEESIDNIAKYVENTFQFIRDVNSQSVNVDRIEAYGQFLYDHNLAHPSDPRRHKIVNESNPFDPLIDKLCIELYSILPSDYETMDENDKDTRNFQFGFGIARLAYNAYRLEKDRAFAAAMVNSK